MTYTLNCYAPRMQQYYYMHFHYNILYLPSNCNSISTATVNVSGSAEIEEKFAIYIADFQCTRYHFDLMNLLIKSVTVPNSACPSVVHPNLCSTWRMRT